MRNAPAVHYPVGRCHFHGWLVLIASSIGLAVLVRWNFAVDVRPVVKWSSMVIFTALTVNAAYRWRITRKDELIWTGQMWKFTGLTNRTETQPPKILDVAVVLDLKATVLVRISGSHGKKRWVWTESRQLPLRWLAHRRALFAPQWRRPPKQASVSGDSSPKWVEPGGQTSLPRP